jgi:uncharacterized protein YbjT (DUF2867 family)
MPRVVSELRAAEGCEIADVARFVYVSIAQPAAVMQSYIAARHEAENAVRSSGRNATILRPWYVLGPGRRWPILLLPALLAAGRDPVHAFVGPPPRPRRSPEIRAGIR